MRISSLQIEFSLELYILLTTLATIIDAVWTVVH